LGRRMALSELIEHYMVYPSRRRILHKVRDVKYSGDLLHLTMACGINVRVRNSKRSRAARWIAKMIYWEPCRYCGIPKSFLAAHPPRERLKHEEKQAMRIQYGRSFRKRKPSYDG